MAERLGLHTIGLAPERDSFPEREKPTLKNDKTQSEDWVFK